MRVNKLQSPQPYFHILDGIHLTSKQKKQLCVDHHLLFVLSAAPQLKKKNNSSAHIDHSFSDTVAPFRRRRFHQFIADLRRNVILYNFAVLKKTRLFTIRAYISSTST